MVYTLSVKQIDCLYNNDEMTEKEAEDLLLQSPIKDLVQLILNKKPSADDYSTDSSKEELDNFEDSIKSNM